MDDNRFTQFVRENRGKIIGGLVGLFCAILILEYGFFKSLFIFALVGVGIYFGSRRENREKFVTFVENLVDKDKEN